MSTSPNGDRLLRVDALSAERHLEYDEFVRCHRNALLYQSSKFQLFVSTILNCELATLLCIDSSDTILGALPLMAMRGSFGVVYNSLPFYGSNGGVIADDKDAGEMLISTFESIASRSDVAAYTVVGNPLDPISSLRFPIRASHLDSRIGQFTYLAGSDTGGRPLFERIHYKTRNAIRKASKLGISVKTDNTALDFLAKIHTENLTALSGIPKPPMFFKAIPAFFDAGRDFRIYVADLDGERIAALLVFYFGRTVEYYMPVVVEAHRSTQAISLLAFHAMQEAIDENAEIWNWGGTWHTQTGVFHFKSRWDTKHNEYQYRCQINNPEILTQQLSTLIEEYPYFFVAPSAALSERTE